MNKKLEKEFDDCKEWATNSVTVGDIKWEMIVADKTKIKDFIHQALQSERDKIIEICEGMKKKNAKGIEFELEEEQVKAGMHWSNVAGYNEALIDLITKLQPPKE